MTPCCEFPKLLFFSAFIICSKSAANPDDGQTKPNVVIFLADDLGYGDLGCYGNAEVKTPTVDSLAEEGLTFSRMYSQPVCTPARAALLTGSYPVRYGLMGDSMSFFGPKWPVFRSHAQPGGLQCRNDALPGIFKSQGYLSAMIGKWHLGIGRSGEYLPRQCGFNLFYGTPGSHCAGCADDEKYRLTDHELFVRYVSSQIPALCAAVAFLLTGVYMGVIGKRTVLLVLGCLCTGLLLYRGFLFTLHDNPMSCILMKNEEVLEQPYKAENITLRMTDEALGFISDTVTSKSPFFLMMSYLQPHVPSFRSLYFTNKSKLGPYYDSVMEMDWSMGVIMDQIKNLGIKNNTLIIFASDNGPELTNPITGVPNPGEMQGSTVYRANRFAQGLRLSGEKGSVWEAGIRVPVIMSWPGHITPGSKTEILSSLMDVFPTIQDILKVGKLNRFIDGKSLIPVFADPEVKRHHDILLHFCDMNGVAAVSYGDYKLHYTKGYNNHSCTGVMLQPPLLFNIAEDPGETTPLSIRTNEPLLHQIHKDVIRQQTTLLPKIVAQSSQFSRLPRPWYFPCANFPYCREELQEEQNFEHLFKKS